MISILAVEAIGTEPGDGGPVGQFDHTLVIAVEVEMLVVGDLSQQVAAVEVGPDPWDTGFAAESAGREQLCLDVGLSPYGARILGLIGEVELLGQLCLFHHADVSPRKSNRLLQPE